MVTKSFSGALQLTDLDDFIGPSQICIIPVQKKLGDENDGMIKLQNKKRLNEKEEPRIQAKITLNDCLACSGCITSAESILIDQQDYHEAQNILKLNQTLKDNNSTSSDIKTIICSISPQSLSSIAVKYNLEPTVCARRITNFLKKILGVNYVFDVTYARNFSLMEIKNEFIKRYRNNKQYLPLLTSECPGWICYAEKTQGSYILPYISKVKSPQQVLGSFIKNYFMKINNSISEHNLYHFTVQPCYDKKLEASRQEFYDENLNIHDVDCVISTGEFHQWLEEDKFDAANVNEMEYDEPFCMKSENGLYLNHRGSGSGGYLEYVYRCAAKELFNVDIEDKIELKTIRNQDFRETVLKVDGEDKLRFAHAYGFRNIQNIVQKLKRGKCEYDFVEIMACPSGCLNGGGQIRASTTDDQIKLLEKVTNAYESLPMSSDKVLLEIDVLEQQDVRMEDDEIEWDTDEEDQDLAIDNSTNKTENSKDIGEEKNNNVISNGGTVGTNEVKTKNNQIKTSFSTSFDNKERTQHSKTFTIIEVLYSVLYFKHKVYIRDGPNSHHVEMIPFDTKEYDLPSIEELALVDLTVDDMNSVFKSLDIDEKDFHTSSFSGSYRPESVLVRGVTNMSTQEILNCFEGYKPIGIEWICDHSCNVFWHDTINPLKMLFTISTVGPKIRHRRPVNYEHAMKLQKQQSEEENKADSENDKQEPSIVETTVPLPPGHWRVANLSLKALISESTTSSSTQLFFRYTSVSDRKPRGAEKDSRYYREYGNPNYNGMKGLISRSKKRELNQASNKSKQQREQLYRDFIIVKPIISETKDEISDEKYTEEEETDIVLIENEKQDEDDENVKFTVVLPPKQSAEAETNDDNDNHAQPSILEETISKRKYSTDEEESDQYEHHQLETHDENIDDDTTFTVTINSGTNDLRSKLNSLRKKDDENNQTKRMKIDDDVDTVETKKV
ncbi:unnamed protein product [Didymodactylos carnosus]|uniref:Iron hydrogenase large subunit C-terminal domain-containing protein n=1 Tax=Didymodactylos carnosus TaxID=1234261 RepID=A0A814BR59_9BILA|nr:unnamed protein product [Didymodactylos carnosus]CAF3708163.1 unnamed protein product [Didymodactylos carnosus]